MNDYEVFISKTIRKQIEALPESVQNKILEILFNLAYKPRPAGCKKLKGFKNIFRIRIGHYRIIYEVEDKICRIMVMAVGRRKDIY